MHWTIAPCGQRTVASCAVCQFYHSTLFGHGSGLRDSCGAQGSNGCPQQKAHGSWKRAMDTVAAASSSNAISLVPSILSMAPRSRVPPPVLVAPSSSSQSLTSLAHAPTPPDWTPMSAAAAVAASRYLAGAPPTTKSSEMKIAAVASATAAAASLGSDVSSLMSNLASLPAASKQATATTAIQPGRSMLLRGSSGSGSGSGSGFSHGATLVASPAQAKTKSSHLGSGSGSNLVNATPQVRTKPLVLASKVIKS
jgi:hypothetical protein